MDRQGLRRGGSGVGKREEFRGGGDGDGSVLFDFGAAVVDAAAARLAGGADFEGVRAGDREAEADVQFRGDALDRAGEQGVDHGAVEQGGKDAAVDATCVALVDVCGFPGGDGDAVFADGEFEVEAVGVGGAAGEALLVGFLKVPGLLAELLVRGHKRACARNNGSQTSFWGD